MPFPIKICAVCEEEFELRPGKPGFSNQCPSCSEPEQANAGSGTMDAGDRRGNAEANAARRAAIRDLLYSGK